MLKHRVGAEPEGLRMGAILFGAGWGCWEALADGVYDSDIPNRPPMNSSPQRDGRDIFFSQ
jgi:hypothetical protein